MNTKSKVNVVVAVSSIAVAAFLAKVAGSPTSDGSSAGIGTWIALGVVNYLNAITGNQGGKCVGELIDDISPATRSYSTITTCATSSRRRRFLSSMASSAKPPRKSRHH